MKGYLPTSYGDSFAGDDFEGIFAFLPELDIMVDVLAEYAGEGPALELGIGTGRVARPLASRGIPVHGIEISPEMVDTLRASSAALQITLTQGSFVDLVSTVQYPLIFCVWNTFYSLTTAEEQMTALRRIAASLAPGGAFVMEAFVPDPSYFTGDQEIRIREITADSVSLQISQHYPDRQTVESQHIVISRDGNRLHPHVIRYAYPDEIDRMARSSRLGLEDRWANWSRKPFGTGSFKHVSVYRLADAGNWSTRSAVAES